MNSQIKQVILTIVASLSFASLAHAHTHPVHVAHEGCCAEVYSETPAIDYNGAIYDSYGYVSVGLGPVFFAPNLGIGYRERHANLGWDTSLSVSTIGYAHALNGSLVGHLYFSPVRQNSGYVGLGVMTSAISTNRGDVAGTVSTDLVFGKELSWDGCGRHFVEMHVGVPTLLIERAHSRNLYLPLVYVKYGTSF